MLPSPKLKVQSICAFPAPKPAKAAPPQQPKALHRRQGTVHSGMRLTLTEIYDAKVAADALRPDPAQLAVLPQLESLRLWLEANANRKIGLFAGLFAKPVTPPPGLYLWGGVGRGKSMLMDLFTENTAITQKRRVHFHAFMQEIHHGPVSYTHLDVYKRQP